MHPLQVKDVLRTFKFDPPLLGHYAHTQKEKSGVVFHVAFPSKYCAFFNACGPSVKS